MANRFLVMLADTWSATKHRSGGMYLSEKLDGMRCLWIPASRGKVVESLPFANRDKDNRQHTATGLWSRYGKIIHCPDWFVKGWPDYPLDGELYCGRGCFQELMSTVKKLIGRDSEWKGVKYLVFDKPRYEDIFTSGKISSPQYNKIIDSDNCFNSLGIIRNLSVVSSNFDTNYRLMKRDLKATETLVLHEQCLLPFVTTTAIEIISKRLDEITGEGGEGLILRHPASIWEPIRSRFLLKVKSLQDDEGIIVGFRAGCGKYNGMIGSVTVKWSKGVFELSGFTDEERRLTTDWQKWSSGEMFPLDCNPAVHFKIGEKISFKYRELSNDNVPKEGRFWRKASLYETSSL